MCRADEVPPGRRKIVDFRGSEVGIFNLGGRFYAARNHCPHRGAPVCLGRAGGTLGESAPHEYVYVDRPILACPWHQWEFDLATGECLTDGKARVKVYEAAIEGEHVTLRPARRGRRAKEGPDAG